MAFIKKIWKDRISQFPNRRTINDGNVTKQVTVGRDEGTITEQGDAFDASNMNDLEQRIDDAYGDVQALVGSEVAAQYDSANVIFDPVATEGHGTGFVVSSDYIANLKASDLKDVNITSPTQGEALVFDADGNLVNGTVSTVGNLDDLNDVDTTGKANDDSLRYNSTTSKWEAKPTTIEMTQAEYNAIVDFTPYANTHIVITDAPNLNATASDIEYSSGVTVKQQLDKSILYNANGIFITKVGHSYLASFASAKISDVYTVLDDYNPSGVFLNAVWNSDTAKANVVRISGGTVTVLDTNPWSAIASTDTTKIQGSLAWND